MTPTERLEAAPMRLQRRVTNRWRNEQSTVCRHCRKAIRRYCWGELGWGHWHHSVDGSRTCAGSVGVSMTNPEPRPKRSELEWALLDVIRTHRYDFQSSGTKPADPGWHPCRCGWEGYWSSFEPHVAACVQAALLGLPPSVRAQLVGLGLEEEWERRVPVESKCLGVPERHISYVARLGSRKELEAGDLAATAIKRAGPTTYRMRLVTSWLPDPTPPGVAGRNQPNPKEGS